MKSDKKTDQQTLPEYANNPFISRLPPIRSLRDIQSGLNRPPLHSEADRMMAPEYRIHACQRLIHYSQPTVAARDVGLKIDIMIHQGYLGRNPVSSDWMRFANACAGEEQTQFAKDKARTRERDLTGSTALGDLAPMKDTSMSLLIAGPPGTGKTHAMKATLAHYQQVIFHEIPIQVAQITWLRVECPPDGSLVSLCRYFFAAVDTTLRQAGFVSDLEKQYRSKPLSILLPGMARVANLHAIGILVIDEIQHVGINRKDGNALLNFLVTLRNSIGIPMLMIGTMSAVIILQRTFRDARRGDGLGSVLFERMPRAPSEPGGQIGNGSASASKDEPTPIYGLQFQDFVTRMFRWQYTNTPTELSVEIMNAFYEETQGVTDLVVKLFVLCQIHLMMFTSAHPGNKEIITADLIHQIAKKSFNTVKPFIDALRNNDMKALQNFEDLMGSNEWFMNQVHGLGFAENEPLHDEGHGATHLPPMVTEKGIDGDVVNQLLEGLGVSVKDRGKIVARHRKLIEAGLIADLVTQVRKDLDALTAIGKVGKEKRKEIPPTDESDLRSCLSEIKEAADVPSAVNAVQLEDALR